MKAVAKMNQEQTTSQQTMSDYQRRRMGEILNAAHQTAQRKCDGPTEQLFCALLHAAVALAGEHGRGRSRIAAELGIAKDTIEKKLGGLQKYFSQSEIARLLFDPSVLGPDAHGWLIARLALLADRKMLMSVEHDGEQSALRSAMEVTDADGFLAMTVLNATDPESEGGEAITGTEDRKIAAAAGMVAREALEMVGGEA